MVIIEKFFFDVKGLCLEIQNREKKSMQVAGLENDLRSKVGGENFKESDFLNLQGIGRVFPSV